MIHTKISFLLAAALALAFTVQAANGASLNSVGAIKERAIGPILCATDTPRRWRLRVRDCSWTSQCMASPHRRGPDLVRTRSPAAQAVVAAINSRPADRALILAIGICKLLQRDRADTARAMDPLHATIEKFAADD